MADFEREAELSIAIPERELRDARDELEDALADVPVGVSASGGGGGGATGTNSAREQRRRRREFRWARQRTDDVERQVELLENIEGELTEGGLGGGGDIFGDLLGLTGEGAGIATDLGTSVVDVLAPALGSLVGTAVGQKVSDATRGGGDLQIQEPLGVTVKNTPLDVRDDGGGPSVTVDAPDVSPVFEPVFEPQFGPAFEPTFEPTFQPTFRPDFSMDVNVSPELDLPDFDFSGGGSGLTEPVDVIVTNTPLSVSGRRPTGGRPAPTGGRGERPLGPGESLGRGLDTATDIIEEQLGLPESDRGPTNQRIGRFVDRINPAFGGFGQLPDRRGGGGAPAGVSASTGAVNVTMNVDVQSAVQQAVEQVRREQERQRQELRRDLEGQISDLRRQIQSGGRSGLGGSVR